MTISQGGNYEFAMAKAACDSAAYEYLRKAAMDMDGSLTADDQVAHVRYKAQCGRYGGDGQRGLPYWQPGGAIRMRRH